MNNQHLKLTRAATALALSCLATNAIADGYVEEKNAPELWSGPYFGAYFGGGAGHSNASFNQVTRTTSFITNATGSINTNNARDTTTSGRLTARNTTGSAADLFAGYNWHKNNSTFLLGAQLEGTFFSDISTKSSAVLDTVAIDNNLLLNAITTSHTGTLISTRYDLSSMLSVIARAGGLVRPNTLIYGLVGPTEGNFVIPSGLENALFDKSQWQLGVSAGAGLEHKFNKNWSMIAEYRYLHFNLNNTSNASTPETSTTTANPALTLNTRNTLLTWDTHFSMNVGKIGIVFRC